MTPELIHRLHFAFTITFHYLFPQLTMGLALLIVVLKTVALRTGSEEWDRASRFWARIFGINFVFGVVTRIPMEFERVRAGACIPGCCPQPLGPIATSRSIARSPAPTRWLSAWCGGFSA